MKCFPFLLILLLVYSGFLVLSLGDHLASRASFCLTPEGLRLTQRDATQPLWLEGMSMSVFG